MFVYIIVLIFLLLIGVKVQNNEKYLGKGQTTIIKGVFVVIVFLSHCRGYFTKTGGGDSTDLFDYIITWIGQLMVAPFLFYSGYGVMESVRQKKDYVQTFPRNRIVLTIIHLIIALIPYVVINIILDISYPVKNYVFCWIGVETIGNSNWFVFDILILYFITWIVFSLKINEENKLIVTTCSTLVVIAGMIALHKEGWWYNTLLCYPLGMWFSCNREKIERVVRKKYWTVLISISGLFLILHAIDKLAAYMISACLFCIVITIISMRVCIDNPIIDWFGRHVFEIYIMQRIPMTILNKYCVLPPWIFTMISFVVVCGFAVLLRKIYSFVDMQWRKISA